MKRYITLLFLTVFSGILYAQNADDALRYSQQYYTGTARSMAMGGAFGALGGDYSSIGINPAGLAIYQSSEFTFTPTFELRKSKSENLDEDKFTFGISNIGYVSTMKPRVSSKNGWQNFNFAIGYNKLNNFRKSSASEVENSPNSMLDEFAKNANGTSHSNLNLFYEDLAFATYLIDTIKNNNLQYITPLLDNDLMYQKKIINEKGYTGGFNISMGANYSHKLYLGASIGIQSIYYKSKIIYEEKTYKGSNSALYNYTFNQNLRTNGIGFNFKFGVIYKPIQQVRLGASIHTPTFISMTDDYQNEMASSFDPKLFKDKDGNSNFNAKSRTGTFDYKLRTPTRFTFSGAFIISKKAILSVDYELTDYSQAKFSNDKGNSNTFSNTNNEIKNIYQSTNNIRTGIEYRITSAFSVRGGFARIESPYKNSFVDESFNIYSAGFGVRQGNFFFDTAYSYSTKDEAYNYYNNAKTVKLEDKNHQMRLTFGFKF